MKNRKKNGDKESGSSDDGGCSSGGGLLNILKSVSCAVNKAKDVLSGGGGAKSIGNLINHGWDLTNQGFAQLKNDFPDPKDLTGKQQQNFKNQIKELTEGTEALNELENKEEKEEKNKSTESSSSQTKTDSTTSESTTCTASTTATDCTVSTLFITAITTGGDGSPDTSVSTSTTSDCDITATTMATTITTGGACSMATIPSSVMASVYKTIGDESITPLTGPITADGTTVDVATATASDSSTITGTTLTTTTRTSMSGPCEVQSFQLATGMQPFCRCTTNTGSETVTSTITTASDGGCADYTAFPSSGFINRPTITSYNELCQYNFGKDSKSGYCACQTSASSGNTTSQ